MSETLERSAEIAKLARLLDVDPDELGFLAATPSGAVAEFRARATERLYRRDAGMLRRVAAASRLLPVPLTVTLAQVAFGPMLCAATAGLLEPDRAARIAGRAPVPFLADITVHLDPRRSAAVIAAIPAPVVVAVARELLTRDEHVTMGRFVSVLPRATLAAAVPQIESDADLLRVAFVMEGKERLGELVDLARDRFGGLIRAAHEHDLWAEALDLIGHVPTARLAEIGDAAAAQDPEVLDALVHAAQRMGEWDVLLPVIAVMSGESLDRLAASPAVLGSGVLHDIADAALAHDLWLDLLPLTRHLPPDALAQVAERAATQDDDVLDRLVGTAYESGVWDEMLRIALALPPEARRRLAALPALRRDGVLTALVQAPLPDPDALTPLLDVLPDDVRDALLARATELGRPEVVALLTSASGS